ncbi:hypothetical protein [Plastoroseomonas arctica]|uniref:Uncharacterized protein n=1 Tax=Plastoroseomonas arctica TaxID=1509237 RepID=A0AAF1K3P2_9PROT|nr:hypothetical protein [Plastoroseomonas arctica]MBR0656163.1 hypothetical protein [Plastoroseomonas arctica]
MSLWRERAWPILAPLLAGLAAWLGWMAGGWGAEASGLSVLEMPLRFTAVVVALGLFELLLD